MVLLQEEKNQGEKGLRRLGEREREVCSKKGGRTVKVLAGQIPSDKR